MNKNKNKINLRNHGFVRKKQNGGWKLSDTDWFYFSFYNPSCLFFMIRFDPSPILFYFYFFIRSELVRVDPSWSDPDWRSELIRSDFCTRLICHCDRFIFCILLWVHHNSMLLTLRKKFICSTVLHTVFIIFASQLTAALPFSMWTSRF